jgi:DNA polymerase
MMAGMKRDAEARRLAGLLLSEWARVYGPITPLVARRALVEARDDRERKGPVAEDPTRCRRCPRHRSGGRAPAGTGRRRTPPFMFIAGTPGREAEREGDLYAGPSGELLTRMIERGMGLGRGEVYFTHLVKCWCPGGEDPAPEEVAGCLPLLLHQIETIAPRVIICLGRIAAGRLLETNKPVAFLRGRIHSFMGFPLVVTHHPAFLLRHPDRKREAWEDLKAAMERAGMAGGARND